MHTRAVHRGRSKQFRSTGESKPQWKGDYCMSFASDERLYVIILVKHFHLVCFATFSPASTMTEQHGNTIPHFSVMVLAAKASRHNKKKHPCDKRKPQTHIYLGTPRKFMSLMNCINASQTLHSGNLIQST